jgi:hypothetical protein
MPQWKMIVGRGFNSEEFQEYVSKIDFSETFAKFVVVHNTSVPTLGQWHSVDPLSRMRGFTYYYRDQMKWSAGPHLFVADDKIWVFTPLTKTGVHSPSWNNRSFGVEIVLDGEAEPFTEPQKSLAISAITTLHVAAKLNPDMLKFHHEDPLTTHKCPGKNIVKPDVVAAVKAEIAKRAGK